MAGSFCGRPDQHPYELFLQLEEIEHRSTRVKRPQSNGIIERFHRTALDERFRVEGRKTWFETLEGMQAVLDEWLIGYNSKRPHQGRNMNGRTPLKAFTDGITKPDTKPKGERPAKRSEPPLPDDPLKTRLCQVIAVSVHKHFFAQ